MVTLGYMADTGVQPDAGRQRRPSGKWRLAVVATVVIGVAVAVAALVTDGRSGPEVPEIGCLAWRNRPQGDEHYGREEADRARRHPITAAQHAAAEQARRDVGRVIGRIGDCVTAAGFPCERDVARRPATASDATDTAEGLSRAGFGNSVVRVARADDPAPLGSLFYAVHVADQVCVVGYVLEVPGGAGSESVVGTLPGGRCAAS